MDDAPDLKSSRAWQDELRTPSCQTRKTKPGSQDYYKPKWACDRCLRANIACSRFGLRWLCGSCYETRREI